MQLAYLGTRSILLSKQQAWSLFVRLCKCWCLLRLRARNGSAVGTYQLPFSVGIAFSLIICNACNYLHPLVVLVTTLPIVCNAYCYIKVWYNYNKNTSRYFWKYCQINSIVPGFLVMLNSPVTMETVLDNKHLLLLQQRHNSFSSTESSPDKNLYCKAK